MTVKKSRRRQPRLSAALRRTIAIETAGCFVDNEVLGKKDVTVLKQILSGDYAPDVEISRKRALGALARSDKSKEAGELIGRILSDRNAPPRERAAAAAYLGILPPEAAEKPLLAALAKSHGLLRLEIIQSIGQVGTTRALARLRRLELHEGDVAKRPLTLAQLAISFREGRRDTGPDELTSKLHLDWNSIDAKRIDPKAVRETISSLGGPNYGVPLRLDFALRFDCGRLSSVVLLNKALKPGTFLRDVADGSMIAALIVSQAERKLSYFTVRWLLLTSPGQDAIRMVMVRPNGNPAFEGRAVSNGDRLRFTLRETGLERTPTEISGYVTNDDIKWTIRVWQGPLRDKQRPRTIMGSAAQPPV